MKTVELREAFLSFFKNRDHEVVSSSSLVPFDDPTLLFTNAGMNQFKDPLLGKSNPGYSRAASAQRCVRAGGKHNDLENVGYTARHHTFFEMMGNFSFGDYFKEETIEMAWSFTNGVMKIPQEKLIVTVHPTDTESADIWKKKIGIDDSRIIQLEENFWTMGDTGPCGPCTELFYDHGELLQGGPPGSPDEDGDRYIEFWNLVFPQFDRSPDGHMEPLPSPGVDTGMGLERMAAILQGVQSNYEIDLFQNLIRPIGEMLGKSEREALSSSSVRVIADHLRSTAFLIADGIRPGNEDRSYVLRRIMRRALRHAHKLGLKEPFLFKLVNPLVQEMGDAYPILVDKEMEIVQAIEEEEHRFGETLNQGMILLKAELEKIGSKDLPGETAFKLYDTYGFPLDLTKDVLRELDRNLDEAGFDRAMEAQREKGRASAGFSANLGQKITVSSPVVFLGYENTHANMEVLALFDLDGEPVESLSEGRGVIVADKTVFYAESGGQLGDQGLLANSDFVFRVEDTQKSGVQTLHIGSVVKGMAEIGVVLDGEIDVDRRRQLSGSHSATHLMHAALREQLGSHVQQKGSLVAEERLRFDFSHEGSLNREELVEIEKVVGEQVRMNTYVDVSLMPYERAISSGALAFFGEKYAEEVRVVRMGGDYSAELCGGTHVARTGEIGGFKIVSETGVASGVRRIEALTGAQALNESQVEQGRLLRISEYLKTDVSRIEDRVEQLVEENKRLLKEMSGISQRLAADSIGELEKGVTQVGEVCYLGAKITGDSDLALKLLDSLKSKYSEKYVFLIVHQSDQSAGLVTVVSKDLVKKISAGDLVRKHAPIIGAKGGGRPDMARAGGGDKLDAIPELIKRVKQTLKESVV